MSRIFNFSAGPSTLPLSVLEEARDEMVEYKSAGLSIIEASHRSKEYDAIHTEGQSLIKELLNIPDHYEILFLGGGATLQFSMVPLNFLTEGNSCDFTVTGTWAKKAYGDHKKVGKVRVVYDGKDENYLSLPDPSSLDLDSKASYFHMTSNETIGGVQWNSWPDTGDVPIICDMSSDIFSRSIPIEKFGMIYAGAQKNLGPAGVTLVIIRQDMLERCSDHLTAYLNYKTHSEKNSLYNTPPVFPIYMSGKVLRLLKEQGGMEGTEKRATEKSGYLYGAMEKNPDFYQCPVSAHCRSKMNVVFRLPSEDLEKKFILEASEAGFRGLKGHRSVGGCRASIYNAMPMEGVQGLAQFMDDFAQKNG